MTSPFNPKPTFPFCVDQTDFLCFRSLDGFAAIDLNLVEGFTAGGSDSNGDHSPSVTTIQLVNNNQYYSTETVPELVARYSAVKHARYSLERLETEVVAAATPKASVPVPVPVHGEPLRKEEALPAEVPKMGIFTPARRP